MKLLTAIKKFAVENLFDFKGRASRFEYWGGGLGAFFLGIFVLIAFLFATGSETLYSAGLLLFSLWMWLGNLSCSIRRCHDVGKSGLNMLWTLTGIGSFYILYLFVQPSIQKDNEWGPTPPHTITA